MISTNCIYYYSLLYIYLVLSGANSKHPPVHGIIFITLKYIISHHPLRESY